MYLAVVEKPKKSSFFSGNLEQVHQHRLEAKSDRPWQKHFTVEALLTNEKLVFTETLKGFKFETNRRGWFVLTV